MTYAASQVGYWVGQANDNSTGTHPPSGYTPGQRWFTTSSQWQTVYSTEYANARDNSTGQHPTGWVSGQFWSTTASQWVPMYNAEFANARDNSGGQASGGLGPQHPNGYGSGQFWSTTAQQWCDMWSGEWHNSHDPQGYSFSYPNAGPNAVYWSQTASYWRSQTDYYYGPSRVWGNGATWEQNYNAYVGYYNDMVNQRDTWVARANSAWGPSRVWPQGESWEAAYNRVLPLGSPYTMTWQGANWQDGQAFPGGGVVNGSVDRSGYWLIYWIFRADGSLSAQQTQLWLGGGYTGVGSYADAGGGESVHADTGNSYLTGAIGAGTSIEIRGDSGFSGHPLVTLRATFIPTQAYPR